MSLMVRRFTSNNILKDPETYFTPEVMEKLDQIAKREFEPMEKIEFLILKNLLHNEEYLRKVIPFLKSEYYQDNNQRIVFEEIQSFVDQYNDVPTKEILTIEIEKRKDINETTFKELTQVISYLDNEPVEFDWLVDTTEKWCKERVVYLTLLESIAIRMVVMTRKHLINLSLLFFLMLTCS